MSGLDNRLRVEKARWVLSVCFAREVSCRVRAGEAARPGREYAILNAQEIEAFSQVQTVRFPAVASS